MFSQRLLPLLAILILAAEVVIAATNQPIPLRHSALLQRLHHEDPAIRNVHRLEHLKKSLQGRGTQTLQARKNGSTAIALGDYQDEIKYLIDVSIGSPPQTVTLWLDLASGFAWVQGGSTCNSSLCRENSFNASASSTYHENGTNLDLGYIGVSNHVAVARDVMTVGDIAIPDQLFGVDAKQNNSYPDSSGIFGLTIPPSTDDPQDWPFWRRSHSENSEDGIAFAIRLAKYRNGPSDGNVSWSNSYLSFGTYDQTLAPGALEFVASPYDDPSWDLPLDSLLFNDKVVNTTRMKMTFDTGSCVILAPRTVTSGIFEAIPGSQFWNESLLLDNFGGGGLYQYPCNARTNLAFNFSGQIFGIDDTEFKWSDDGHGMCISTVMPWDSDDWLVGTPFLKTVYSIFKADPKSIAFVQLP